MTETTRSQRSILDRLRKHEDVDLDEFLNFIGTIDPEDQNFHEADHIAWDAMDRILRGVPDGYDRALERAKEGTKVHRLARFRAVRAKKAALAA